MKAIARLVGKHQRASAKTAVPLYGQVAAYQHVNMTTCKRALPSGEALERQIQEAAPEADVLSLSSYCPLLVGLSFGKKVGRSVRPRSCPPHVLLLSSCCPVSFFESSLAAAASISPVVLLPSSSCLSFVFSSSSPLVLLLACSPHVVLWCFWRSPVTACPSFVLLVSWCVRVVCLPSSFCPLLSVLRPYVLLWSFCCPAAVVLFTLLSGNGVGLRPPTTTIILGQLYSCLGSGLVYVFSEYNSRGTGYQIQLEFPTPVQFHPKSSPGPFLCISSPEEFKIRQFASSSLHPPS